MKPSVYKWDTSSKNSKGNHHVSRQKYREWDKFSQNQNFKAFHHIRDCKFTSDEKRESLLDKYSEKKVAAGKEVSKSVKSAKDPMKSPEEEIFTIIL